MALANIQEIKQRYLKSVEQIMINPHDLDAEDDMIADGYFLMNNCTLYSDCQTYKQLYDKIKEETMTKKEV